TLLGWFPCFFFQAEDGIRDFHVTGVQTCALPISRSPYAPVPSCEHPVGAWSMAVPSDPPSWRAPAAVRRRVVQRTPVPRRGEHKIGRASCRERGCISVGAGTGH